MKKKNDKSSQSIQKKINPLNNELDNLQKRLSENAQKYSELKANIDLEDPEAKEELQALKSEKDLILELIKERQKSIKSLEEDQKIVAEKEDRERTFNELIDLANEAEKLEHEFHEKLE